jgi:hypothetical protein
MSPDSAAWCKSVVVAVGCSLQPKTRSVSVVTRQNGFAGFIFYHLPLRRLPESEQSVNHITQQRSGGKPVLTGGKHK